MDFAFGMNQQQVLEEDYDENYEPTEEEILEYCKVLELDPVTEKDLMYIAKEGIKAPLPHQWKPVEQPGGGIYYFNFMTGASTWEHPCDEFYRNLLKQEREKKKKVGSTVAKTKSSGVSGKKKGIKIASVKQHAPSSTSGMGDGIGMLHDRGSVDPGGGDIHPAQLMNSTTALAARSNVPGAGGGFQSIRGGLSSPAQIKLGEPQLGKQQSSPGHSRLAPLPSSGSKPLASISGLPVLKAPQALAPVRIPSGMSTTGSSLVGSLGSTGGSGESTRRSVDPLANSHLRNVELGTIGISNEFEEEDDNEESKSESDLGVGFNKFGMNLIGAEDLGLKDTEDSTEDVSKELRKIMEITDASDDDDAAASEFLKRPLGPPPSPPVSAVVGGVYVKGSHLAAGEVASLSPRFQRPSAAKSRDRSDSYKERSDQHTTPVKSSQQPVAKFTPLSISVSEKAPGTNSVTTTPLIKETPPQSVTSREAQLLAAEHSRSVDNLKRSHAEELTKLRQQFAQELEDLKKSLVDQNEVSLDSFRKKLAAEQLSDEKQLRSQKETFLSELRSHIKEEGDEEEAKLMEAKQDSIRKLKQQIAIEQEKDEKQLRETKERTLSNLRNQIREQQSLEESQVRSSSSGELAKLKERLDCELTEERRKIESSHEEEIKTIRERGEGELEEKKDELERELKKQWEALQSLEDEQQKALDNARAELEKAHNLEEFKAEALQTHQQAQEEIEAEFASELEKKKATFNKQHQAEIVLLKEQLAEELEQLRKKENEKLEQEREQFAEELKSSKDVLTQEHEATMKQLQVEYESAQNQLKHLKEEQLQEIASLKSEYDAQCEELSKAKCEVEEQISELETKRNQLHAQEAEVAADEERLEKLRSANAKDTEELLKKQQVELRKDIDKEKKRLSALKKSCGTMENELQQLSKQKEVCLAELERLKTEGESCRSQLSDINSQVKGQKDNELLKKAQKRNAKNSSSSARKTKVSLKEPCRSEEGEKIHLSNGSASVGNNKAKKPTEDENTDESESEEEDVDMTAGSMDLAELGQPSFKHKVANGFKTTTQQYPSDSEDSSVLLSNLQTRLTEKSRELHHTLMAEQDSLVKTKAYLREQQDTLKQRKLVLKLARKDWKTGIKSSKTKGLVTTLGDGNVTLMKDIRSKLDQEAAALNELEERMKMSNNLLARKEQAINRLQASLADELEELSDVESESSSSPPPEMNLDFDIPSPRTYLARLRATLEKSRSYTGSKPNHLPTTIGLGSSSRKRNHTSPLPLVASGLPSLKLSEVLGDGGGLKDGEGSDSDASSLSSSSSSTSVDIKSRNGIAASVNGGKRASQSPSHHYRFSPVSRGIVGGRVTAWDQHVHPSTNGATPLSRQQPLAHSTHTTVPLSGSGGHEGNKEIMSSLQTINVQLGELLSRIYPQPHSSAATPSVVPHPQSRYTPSPSPFAVGDVETPPSLQTSAFLNSSAHRWADPVPQIDHMEMELQRKRQAYLGTHSSLSQQLGSSRFGIGSGSLHLQPSRPQVSTKALMRNQTDWLKEFRQNVPLSSQLKLSSGVPSRSVSSNLPPSNLHSTTTPVPGFTAATGVGGASVLPGELRSHKPSAGSTLLPSKPRLVLDSSNNVQLVHV